MKELSPLKIRERIDNLSYSVLKRKNTDFEITRIWHLKQVLIILAQKKEDELRKHGFRTKVSDIYWGY